MNIHYHLAKLAPLFCGVLCAGLASTHAASTKGSRGTDILHFAAAENMVAADTASQGTGRVFLRHAAQGKVTVQSLDIAVQKLAAETDYVIFATLVNGASAQVGTLATDAKGDAMLRFRKVTHTGNGKSNKLGRGQTALPDELTDLPAVRELSVARKEPNTDPVTYTDVLVADLSEPDRLQYLVKRDLSTEAIRATVQVIANTGRAQFKLSARGLSPQTPYWIAVNTYETPAFATTEVVTDAKGRLEIRTAIEPNTEVLNLHEWQLWGTSTMPVAPEEPILSTVFPTVPTTP